MIIGFSGSMGSGKSTAVDTVRKYSVRSIKLVKFAQPLYDMQEMIYSCIEDVYKRPDSFKKDRLLLQWLGTDWGRNTISPTLWVDLWKHSAQYYDSLDYDIVCDDVRFDNEAEVIKLMGGKIVQLVGRSTKNKGIKNHPSEGGISENLIDITVDNSNCTLTHFEYRIKDLYETLNNEMRNK